MPLSKERAGEIALLVAGELLANDRLFATGSDSEIPKFSKKIRISQEEFAEFLAHMVREISERRLEELGKISKVRRPIGFRSA